MRKLQIVVISILIGILAATILPRAIASPVYLKKLPDGTVVFTSEEPGPDATPLSLPTIARGERTITPIATCRGHGGVLCSAGPDSDGSVVCFDGFRDSAQRYKASCGSVRLEIGEISLEKSTGDVLIYIRNRSSEVASEVELTYLPRLGRRQRFSLPEIMGFDEIPFRLERNKVGPGDTAPRLGELSLSCKNCHSTDTDSDGGSQNASGSEDSFAH